MLACVHSTEIDSQNSKGLNVPNTENQITCLNIVIISVAIVNVRNNHIRFIGNQFAISISTR